MKILLLVLLLSGCATSDAVINRAESVKIGDSYGEMVKKIDSEQYDLRCFKTARGEKCKAIYKLFGIYYIYSFNEKDILTSIYR